MDKIRVHKWWSVHGCEDQALGYEDRNWDSDSECGDVDEGILLVVEEMMAMNAD